MYAAYMWEYWSLRYWVVYIRSRNNFLLQTAVMASSILSLSPAGRCYSHASALQTLKTLSACDWALSLCNSPVFHSAGAGNPMGKLSNCRPLLSKSNQPNTPTYSIHLADNDRSWAVLSTDVFSLCVGSLATEISSGLVQVTRRFFYWEPRRRQHLIPHISEWMWPTHMRTPDPKSAYWRAASIFQMTEYRAHTFSAPFSPILTRSEI